MQGADRLARTEKSFEKISFLNELLVNYGLLKEDSKALHRKQLEFTHLDLELDNGIEYFKRVALWLDFITTVYVMFDREPIILTETGAVPTVKHLVGNLFNKGNLSFSGDDLEFIPVIEIE